MKKLLSLSLVSAMLLGIFACNKVNSPNTGTNPFGASINNNPSSNVANPLDLVGNVPTSFTQKVVIEEFTGEWCGFCPDGAQILDQITSSNAGKIYGAAIHDKDWLEINPFYSQIKTLLPNTYGFPGATANRKPYNGENIFGRGSWEAAATQLLSQTPECGMALVSKEKNDMLDLKVFVGYNAKVNKATKLTIYLLEDGIAHVNQSNATPNYKHNHVVRECFTTTLGDDISLSDVGKKYTLKEFKNLDIAGKYKDKSKLHILAFINTNGADKNGHEILNAQMVGLNETKKWD